MAKDDPAICPQCGLNNTSRLYGSKYTCNRCKIDFIYEKEVDFPRDKKYSDMSYTNDFSPQPSIVDQQMKYVRFSWIMAFLWLFAMAIVYAFAALFSQPDRLTSLKDLLEQGGDFVANFFKTHPDYFLLLIGLFSWISGGIMVIGALLNWDYLYTPPYSRKIQRMVWNRRTWARIVGFIYWVMWLWVVALIVFMKYYNN